MQFYNFPKLKFQPDPIVSARHCRKFESDIYTALHQKTLKTIVLVCLKASGFYPNGGRKRASLAHGLKKAINQNQFF